MSEYYEKGWYQHPNWLRVRATVFERDGNKCTICGAKSCDVQLVGHHLVYIEGKKLWDYLPEMVVTTCKTCHDKLHNVKKCTNIEEAFDYLKKKISSIQDELHGSSLDVSLLSALPTEDMSKQENKYPMKIVNRKAGEVDYFKVAVSKGFRSFVIHTKEKLRMPITSLLEPFTALIQKFAVEIDACKNEEELWDLAMRLKL